MTKLFYATRDDKNGNRLTTSYNTKEKCDKYGVGENRQEWVGARYLDVETGKMTEKDTGFIVRSALKVTDAQKSDNGNFVIYHRDEGGEWIPTSHRYSTYGVANTAMKSFTGVYFDMLIVEEPEHKTEPVGELSSEPAPF